jgi:hypothetical protein
MLSNTIHRSRVDTAVLDAPPISRQFWVLVLLALLCEVALVVHCQVVCVLVGSLEQICRGLLDCKLLLM